MQLARPLLKWDDGRNVFNKNSFREIVVCITGLSSSRKEKLHQIVKRLGGRFTGDLIIEHTTHLIAEVAEGAKHHEAVKSNHIIIVKPSWLEECQAKKKKVSETPHLLHPETEISKHDREEMKINKNVNNVLKNEYANIDLREACLEVLESISMNSLFINCSFFFIGFDDEVKNIMIGNESNIDKNINDCDNANNMNIGNRNDLSSLQTLARLIRHGMGTRYWDLTSSITHVIVNETCDPVTLSVAQYVGANHPNHPAVLSPHWIIQSLSKKYHQPYENFPAKRTKPKFISPSINRTKLSSLSNIKANRNIKLISSIFRGILFSILPSNVSDNFFNASTLSLEEQIVTNGGTILSAGILAALQKDLRMKKKSRRILCVVFMGRMVNNYPNRNILLTHVKRNNLCPLVPVNPNYLLSCIHEKYEFLPDLYPILFQPQPYVLHRLPNTDKLASTPNDDTKQHNKISIVVAVSGFVGVERFGIIQMLKHMGAKYTENLTKANTHLICKNAEGPKFERALVWGQHVVGIDWLYHILKYGYQGNVEIDKEKNKSFCNAMNDKMGCEKKFYLVPLVETDTVTTLEVRKKKRFRKETSTPPNECMKNYEDLSNKKEQKTFSILSSRSSNTIDSVSNEKREMMKHDAQIKSSLEKLQKPIIDASETMKPSYQNVTRVRKKRRWNHQHQKKSKDSMSQTTTKAANGKLGSDDNLEFNKDLTEKFVIGTDNDIQSQNDDEYFGSLVESQSVFFS